MSRPGFGQVSLYSFILIFTAYGFVYQPFSHAHIALFSMKYAIISCMGITASRSRKTVVVTTGYAGNIPYPHSCPTETTALPLHSGGAQM